MRYVMYTLCIFLLCIMWYTCIQHVCICSICDNKYSLTRIFSSHIPYTPLLNITSYTPISYTRSPLMQRTWRWSTRWPSASKPSTAVWWWYPMTLDYYSRLLMRSGSLIGDSRSGPETSGTIIYTCVHSETAIVVAYIWLLYMYTYS